MHLVIPAGLGGRVMSGSVGYCGGLGVDRLLDSTVAAPGSFACPWMGSKKNLREVVSPLPADRVSLAKTTGNRSY
jgi:hypothetical protein